MATRQCSQQQTPGLTSPMTALGLSSQKSGIFFPTSSSTPIPVVKRGRHSRRSKFHGNRFSSLPTNSDDTDTSQPQKPSSKRLRYKTPRCGYTSRFSAPFPFRKTKVEVKRTTDTFNTIKASKPSGMRLLDIGILAEAISKIRCTYCRTGYLSLFESELLHGWQTNFLFKCAHCHRLYAEFPSSKPINSTKSSEFVNVSLPKQGLNEVTMKSVLSVHCSGFSWRDLHKFATLFDMPPPLEHMPTPYLNKIEETVTIAAETSMQGAAEELHLRVDSIPSHIANCINTAVSFDSSWKTRGYFSNVGFGSAISATTKKVLDYVLFNRTCEKCNLWSRERQNNNPEDYKKWYDSHKPHCMKNYGGSSQSMEPEAARMIWVCISTELSNQYSNSKSRFSMRVKCVSTALCVT